LFFYIFCSVSIGLINNKKRNTVSIYQKKNGLFQSFSLFTYKIQQYRTQGPIFTNPHHIGIQQAGLMIPAIGKIIKITPYEPKIRRRVCA